MTTHAPFQPVSSLFFATAYRHLTDGYVFIFNSRTFHAAYATIFDMLKTYMNSCLVLLLITVLLGSCIHQNADDNSIPVQSGKLPIDTVVIGKHTLMVYAIDQAVFDRYPTRPSDTSESHLLSKENNRVKRKGDTLVFNTANGHHVLFIDHNSEETTADYTFDGNFPTIQYWGAYVAYDESGDYILVSQQTGDTVHCWGPPAVAPDKKHIICGSMDLMAGFVDNGFQIFSLQNGKLKLEGQTELEGWGPGEIKWIDKHTILAEYIYLGANSNTESKYVQMRLQ
ncbi:hypothetical protein DCM91_04465 [Chitinophaga costaii]|nr:hypothetical protein DCM91_04465 [Chitinophaga costaii]